mgnify:CR=1 FL=1
MSNILRNDEKDLIELALIDESADYEVDMTEVHYDPETEELVLLTATGCSCWDGDYNEERFKDLDSLKQSLLQEDRKYNPSFKGAEQLVKEAEVEFKKIQPKYIQVGGTFIASRR